MNAVKTKLAFAVALGLCASVAQAQTVEERLSALEAAQAPQTSSTNVFNSSKGKLTFAGDVEFNLDYQDKKGQDKDFDLDQDGRILLDIGGVRETARGVDILFKAQPLLDTTGSVNLDDAWIGFEKKNDWMLKIGRFEAYDMFPVGQDTFLEYSGDSANDLYTNGNGYVYQMKEGRGRGGDSGQLLLAKQHGALYGEVAVMMGDRSDLFKNGYHNESLEPANKDVVIVRPVLAYQANANWKFALGAESNIVKDAITDAAGRDVSDRNGLGFTTTYTRNGFVLNANMARMDALNETNTAAGLNFIYGNFGLGYVYGLSDIDENGWYNGEVKVNTYNASYHIPNILDVSDLSVYLGAYYTEQEAEGAGTAAFKDDHEAGTRVRLKYFF
ncbi:MAG: carbohydrate porin [Aeromonas sp.]